MLNINFFGNTLQSYLISISIIALAALVSVVVQHILRKYILSWARNTETELDDAIARRVLPPLTYLIVLLGIFIAKTPLNFPDNVSLWLNRILLVFVFAITFLILIRLFQEAIEFVAGRIIKGLRQKDLLNEDERIKNVNRIKKQIREISNLILACLAVLTILSNLGISLKAVWASLGIGGIALALAIQEPLRNLVGRIYIFTTGIFDEGHFIVFDNWAGTVKQITAFRTYLEVFSDMTTVSIPNADFVKGAVKTYYGRTTFMYKWDLDVPYGASSQKIQDLISSLRELIHGKPEVNRDMCWIYLDRLDQSSKVVRVWFQVKLPGWAESLFYGNQALHDIQLVFESMNIEFAFPTQTLHLKSEDPFKEGEDKDPLPVVLPE